jgi:cyclase
VDELMLLDITATGDQRDPDYDTIADVSQECFVPLTVGGGVRTLQQVRELLRVGADKVAVNTAFFETPEVVEQGARAFGSQCMVVSLDARREADGSYQCYTHSGKTATGVSPVQAAQQAEQLGAGEVVIHRIEHDGLMQGYDLELIRLVAGAVRIPVIAGGGAGSPSHFLEAHAAGANALAAAALFHFTPHTPLEVKQHLAQNGVPIRAV